MDVDTIDQFNATDARAARTLHSPLLNLILAASILSKITQSKGYLQSPWVPFRPIFGFYPQHPVPQLWYPINPLLFPSRIYSHLSANMPQLQAPPLNQQQIIHIHEAQPLTSDGDNYEEMKNKYTQNINNYPVDDGDDISSSNVDEQKVDIGESVTDKEEMEAASSNASDSSLVDTQNSDVETVFVNPHNDTHESIDYESTTELGSTTMTVALPASDATTTELPVTIFYDVIQHDDVQHDEVQHNYVAHDDVAHDDVAHDDVPHDDVSHNNVPHDNVLHDDIDDISNKPVLEVDNMLHHHPDLQTSSQIKLPCIYEDQFEFTNDLEMADANNIYRRRPKPPANYDYDYYEDDYTSLQNNKKRQRPTNPPRRTQRPRPYKQQPTRINSKRGQYNRPNYDDDYDYTTPKVLRRESTKRNVYRRRTTPSYEFDDYEEIRPVENRRKPVRNSNRRMTTPVQNDYYEDDVYDSGEDYNFNLNNNRQKLMFRPRQGDTSTDSSSTTSTSTVTSTDSTTDTSMTDNTTNGTTQSSGQYPYYGNNVHGNVSFTYGPPINNHHSGYGPSNGNEHISITYGPPTGTGNGQLENFYNQYAKSSVLKRIQELLAPNNFYSPQYDVDKFNYNDNAF